MSQEIWVWENCSECGTMNYLCLGDMEDVSAFEPDGFECRWCSYRWLFEDTDPDWVESCGGFENMIYEKGKKNKEK